MLMKEMSRRSWAVKLKRKVIYNEWIVICPKGPLDKDDLNSTAIKIYDTFYQVSLLL